MSRGTVAYIAIQLEGRPNMKNRPPVAGSSEGHPP